MGIETRHAHDDSVVLLRPKHGQSPGELMGTFKLEARVDHPCVSASDHHRPLLQADPQPMRLPQYSNPQFLSDNTRTVSRRALQLEDDANDDTALGEKADEMMLETKDVEDLHVKLDKIISKRLKLKRSLESSDETSSSKRHKRQRDEGEGKPAEHRDSEPVGKFRSSSSPQSCRQPLKVFRLVSKWLPPRTIYLNSKPSEVIP